MTTVHFFAVLLLSSPLHGAFHEGQAHHRQRMFDNTYTHTFTGYELSTGEEEVVNMARTWHQSFFFFCQLYDLLSKRSRTSQPRQSGNPLREILMETEFTFETDTVVPTETRRNQHRCATIQTHPRATSVCGTLSQNSLGPAACEAPSKAKMPVTERLDYIRR